MLWLALHFPFFALEALSLRQSPSAIAARGRIQAADPVALAAGISPGQKLSTALGLLPELRVCERDPMREARALYNLACWAGRFTPSLSLVPPAGLVLEIGTCRRLFGGIPAIVDALLDGCREQGWHTVDWAVAPTPLGARWLARAAANRSLESKEALMTELAALPCNIPDWPESVVARLDTFGMQTLGDLGRLPTASLRQRIGNETVDELLRAHGGIPDLQSPFIFPERFTAHLDLPSRVELAEGLAFAGQRLFYALAGWLQARQSLLQACSFRMTHDDASVTVLSLRFGEACADEKRFMRLLREHLGQLRLRAPVEALQLDADEIAVRSATSDGLFEQTPTGEGVIACIERLRARLGSEAVLRLAIHPDHRPECASRFHALNGTSLRQSVPVAALPMPPRPLFLLPMPQALREYADGPHWHGPLQFLTRGERIESGWWDSDEPETAGDVRRDYFVVRNKNGQTAWIFRDAEAWYLQGIFA